jgi:hypothetical protein
MLLAACAPGPVPSGPSDSTTGSLAPGSSALPSLDGTGRPPSASPSGASPAPSPAALHAGCPATTGNAGPSSRQRSLHAATTNWSGYVARASKAFSCIQGRWTQPSLTCPASGSASLAIWIGFDGEMGPSRATLEQIGTNTDCRDGRARMFAWFEILPHDRFEQELGLEIRSGDRIVASIAFVGRSYHLVLENLTTGQVEDTWQHSPGSRRLTAEWVVEAPTVGCPSDCQVASLAAFGTVSFSAARVILSSKTGPIGDARWTRVRLDLESRSGLVKARPGTLTKDGAGFAVVWHHR